MKKTLFEVPRIYHEGTYVNPETEVVVWKHVDTGEDKTKKVGYIISRKYKSFLDAEEIRKLKEIINNNEEVKNLRVKNGQAESYIAELDETIVNLRAEIKDLKSENEKLKSEKEELKKTVKDWNKELRRETKASEMYQSQRKDIENEKKNSAALRKRQKELVQSIISKDQTIEELQEKIKRLEDGTMKEGV